MNVQAQVATESSFPTAQNLCAHVVFIHCEDFVFVAVELKEQIGPVWLGMFDTFRDAFDYGVQRGFIPAQHLTLSRQEIISAEKPVLTSDWIPFKKELVVGLIPGHIVNEH